MEKAYTLTEVSDLLEVDPKSLRRWVELEKWDLSEQTAKYDKRVKYLTVEQVTLLAKAHERAWPPVPRQPSEKPLPISPIQFKRLVDRVDMQDAQIDELEQQLTDQGAELIEWRNRVKSLEEAQARATEVMTSLSIAVADQAAQLAALQQTAPRRKTSQAQTDSPDQGDTSELEPGLVSAQAFAQLHNVNVATAKSAYQNERIPTVKGSWHVPNVRGNILVALDAQGRARFYELYHQKDSFETCPECPHRVE